MCRMPSFPLRGALVGAALAATPHGMADCEAGAAALVGPYAAAALLRTEAVTPAFAVLSVLHFAQDLGGVRESAAAHACIVLAAACGHTEAATNVFCAFYLLVHVPRTLRASQPTVRACAAAACAALLPVTCRVRRLSVSTAAQRLVVGHCLRDTQRRAPNAIPLL